MLKKLHKLVTVFTLLVGCYLGYVRAFTIVVSHLSAARKVDDIGFTVRDSKSKKEALFRAGVTGISLSRVSGHGGEREVVEHYRGSSLVLEFHDKVKIEMACSEPFVEPTIQAILSAARTGDVGDGKIFVQPLDRVVRIRTGELDNAALTPVTADEVQRRAQEEHLPTSG